jgi:tetratricopeptide (TPR) repeat protein
MFRHYKKQTFFAVFIVALAWAACAGASSLHIASYDHRALAQDPSQASGPIAPVLSGLGDHHHPVSTRSKQAQYFFDQGLRLTYAFNHQEALRSFKEAVRRDPDCAMAYWGWALVLGPNLNLPMSADVVPQAYAAIQMAVARKNNATDRERAYIDALSKRYHAHPQDNRKQLDIAYAEAMKEVHTQYPDDLDAATLYAAALMNLSPWNYWNKDGQPKPRTPEILQTLETVIEKKPTHAGALHYYIHIVEATDADRGLAAADRLRGLMPGAGHLVHMPTHIYMQVGRYAESFTLNGQAAKADENYLIQCRTQGIYPLGYYPHNLHFQTWAALMLGKPAEALTVARKVASKVPRDLSGNDWALYQTFASMPLFTLIRYGQWDAVLTEPEPPEDWHFVTGMWHYARGMAYTHKGRPQMATEELRKLKSIAQHKSVGEESIGFSKVRPLLTIAGELLTGEMAAKQRDFEAAISHLERAVRLEDGLSYNEPPDWFYPVRHTLGAVLLEADHPAEAEVVYWQDLKRYRNNGYSLYGLWQSLQAQGRSAEAAEIRKRFEQAWNDADVTLSSSRF